MSSLLDADNFNGHYPDLMPGVPNSRVLHYDPVMSSPRENPAANAFATTAQRFCTLMESAIRDRDLWLADVLVALATVYAAAPLVREIPFPESAGKKNIPEDFRVSNDEWNSLYQHLKQTLGPAAHYSAYFNPAAAAPTDEPTQGDLADDLADIYRDLKPGLRAWITEDDRYLEDILYQWTHMGHPHHWGRHAVDAMRALHWLVYH